MHMADITTRRITVWIIIFLVSFSFTVLILRPLTGSVLLHHYCKSVGIGGIYMNAALSLLNQAIYFNVDLVSNSTTAATIAELGPIAMLIGLALVPPVSEEFIMRGTLLESWRRYGP